MYNIPSDIDAPLQIQCSRLTHHLWPSSTIVSGTSDLLNRSDHLWIPSPSSLPSVPPKSSGLSPEVIAGIPWGKLYHNPDFMKEQERAESLQHTVNILVTELVKEWHSDKHWLPICKSINFFEGYTFANPQCQSAPISSYPSFISRSKWLNILWLHQLHLLIHFPKPTVFAPLNLPFPPSTIHPLDMGGLCQWPTGWGHKGQQVASPHASGHPYWRQPWHHSFTMENHLCFCLCHCELKACPSCLSWSLCHFLALKEMIFQSLFSTWVGSGPNQIWNCHPNSLPLRLPMESRHCSGYASTLQTRKN